MIDTRNLSFEWRGREDQEEKSYRWHQRVRVDECEAFHNELVLLGFACDEGVRRNKGRVGAKTGPAAIRAALANLSCPESFSFHDAGDVVCDDEDLDSAQIQLSVRVNEVLRKGGFPIVMGGGHEIAYGSFSGIIDYLDSEEKSRVGILNFDAHFDLRDPSSGANSGTPFRQCLTLCQARQYDFNYAVLGINPSSNTQALFEFARDNNVNWLTDEAMYRTGDEERMGHIRSFLAKCDVLYITICLDVFPGAYAPGVSAPAGMGVHPVEVIKWLKDTFSLCKAMNVIPVVCDIAELNPTFDKDNQTARLAARLIYEITSYRENFEF